MGDPKGVSLLYEPEGKELHWDGLVDANKPQVQQASLSGPTLGRSPRPHPDNVEGMMGTSASQARAAIPAPQAAPKALTPEQLLAMAKEMEAKTAAQYSMIDSSQRDSAGGVMPAWLVNDAKKGGYGG